MKIKEIQNLIKFVAKSGASEVKLEMEDVKITIKTNDGSTPVVVQILIYKKAFTPKVRSNASPSQVEMPSAQIK